MKLDWAEKFRKDCNRIWRRKVSQGEGYCCGTFKEHSLKFLKIDQISSF